MQIRKIMISLLLSLPFAVFAEGFGGIKVTMTDGTSTVIAMDERPVVKFVGDKLVVETDVTTTEFDRMRVKTFNYVSTSSIDEIAVGNNMLNNTGESLQFDNLPADSDITVHDVSGKLVKSAVAEGSYRIDITDLSSGMYVVSVNGVSTKIAVKR